MKEFTMTYKERVIFAALGIAIGMIFILLVAVFVAHADDSRLITIYDDKTDHVGIFKDTHLHVICYTVSIGISCLTEKEIKESMENANK